MTQTHAACHRRDEHAVSSGAVQLGGVGVALSVYGSATKLMNVPLLSVTTQIVATAVGSNEGAPRAPGCASLFYASRLCLILPAFKELVHWTPGTGACKAYGQCSWSLVGRLHAVEEAEGHRAGRIVCTVHRSSGGRHPGTPTRTVSIPSLSRACAV